MDAGPLKSALSLDCSVQGKVFFHTDFFAGGVRKCGVWEVCKAIHFDTKGLP